MPVELVFIHGWGFEAGFWDKLAERLGAYPQRRIDLGFFGKPSVWHPADGANRIVVGHSLGFIYGMTQFENWKGWIAINGFARFVTTPTRPGCVPAAALRDMRRRLLADPAKTLSDFYQSIGADTVRGGANAARLRDGLDLLRDCDLGDVLAATEVPGLVLAARNDPLVPLAAGEHLARFARPHRLALHETGGHLLPQTDPAWCARMIAEFVATGFGAAP
jgi:pimeloyl-[acyl-carrier protein] methyl ester esterase